MAFIKVSEQAVHAQRIGRFLEVAACGNAQSVLLLPQCLKGRAYLFDGQQRLFKVDATGLASPCRGMSTGLFKQFITQVPFLENGATKFPERAVAREYTFDEVTQLVAGIGIEAV